MFTLLALVPVLVLSFDVDSSCAPQQGISKWYSGGWSSRGCGLGCQTETCSKRGMKLAHAGTTTQRGVVYVCCYDPKSGPCYLESKCKSLSTAKGLALGGAGWSFAGDYGTEGCYYYPKNGGSPYAGRAYFGKPAEYESAQKEKDSDQERLPGWDCTPTAAEDAEEAVGNPPCITGEYKNFPDHSCQDKQNGEYYVPKVHSGIKLCCSGKTSTCLPSSILCAETMTGPEAAVQLEAEVADDFNTKDFWTPSEAEVADDFNTKDFWTPSEAEVAREETDPCLGDPIRCWTSSAADETVTMRNSGQPGRSQTAESVMLYGFAMLGLGSILYGAGRYYCVDKEGDNMSTIL